MKMSKAAVKSDLLAHQDLSLGTSGGEECRAGQTGGRERGREVFWKAMLDEQK